MTRHRQTVILSPNNAVELSNLKESLQLGTPAKLSLTEKLTDIAAFSKWLASIPAGSMPRLNMPISLQLLNHPDFPNLIKTLKGLSLDVLEFDFGGELETHIDEIEIKLIGIVSMVDFPIQIKGKKLIAFECAMIQNLQSKPKPHVAAHNPDEPEAESLPDQGKKIRLKALMEADANLNKEEFKQFVDVDVEFVEVVEQNVNLEENIQLEEVVQQQAPYEGELIDYNAFNSRSYRDIAKANFGEAPLDAAYELIHHELFANLPHGIKYLSPIAAKHLAANLPHWAAMNKDNCAPFVLRETAKHEFVLDFDGDEKEKNILFALHEFSPYEEIAPYYDAAFVLPDPEAAGLFFRDKHWKQKLSNLWIRHGDNGISDLYNKLKALDNKHAGLSTFLVDNYLIHFAHWEPFYNENFFEALRKMDDYTPLQMSCLKRFLATTGSSQHNLNKTLEEFDIFWLKCKKLCKDDDKLLQALDTNWSTPRGGQPAVYMERLLTILKNARNLSDQLQSLDGIVLNQYGAYYASHYEGFTEVHPAMGFTYRPDAPFNTQSFNRNFNLYRVNIETLIYEAKKARAMIYSDNFWVIPGFRETQLMQPLESIQNKIPLPDYMEQEEGLAADYHLYSDCRSCGGGLIRAKYEKDDTLPITHKQFANLTYRYIGQQLAGITVQSLNTDLTSEGMSRKLANDLGGFRLCLVQALMFVTSDRYKGFINAHGFDKSTFQAIMETTDSSDFYKNKEVSATIACIKELQANHINFNDQETFFYQGLQKINNNLQLPPEELIHFFFNRVAGLPKRFKEHQAFLEKEGGKHTEKDAWVHWYENAQNNYRARLHHYLLNNKPGALKFINITGPLHTKKKGTFLYAFNTEAFFAEIPQIAQTYRDDLLAFSAQLANPAFNLVSSDFSNTLKTTDEDVVKLKKIRDYVYQSTQGDPLQNYLYYTINRLIDSNTLFTYQQVLNVFEAVSQLKLPSGQLDTAAVHAILEKEGIPVCIKIAEISKYDPILVKMALVSMLIILELGLPNVSDEEQLAQYSEKADLLSKELANLSIPELQERFTKVLPTCNLVVRAAVSVSLKALLRILLQKEIEFLFLGSDIKLREFTQYWMQSIQRLKDLQALNDFVDVEKIAGKVNPIALKFDAVIKNPCVIEHQKEIMQLFSLLDFAQLDSEVLLYWFDFLSEMPQRNYLPLLTVMVNHPELIYQNDTFKMLIHLLKKLNAKDFPTEAITAFYQRFAAAPTTDTTQCEYLISQLVMQFARNNNDPIMVLCLMEPGITLPQAIIISEDTHSCNLHREQLANLYKKFQQTNQLDQFLQLNLHADTKPMILKIMALAYSGRLPTDPPNLDLLCLAQQLQALTPDQLTALNTHYDATLTSIHCLSNALANLKKEEPFSQFLDLIEKSPFGLRDLEAQFNTDEVERVVNGSLDLVNDLPYPYTYRRQLAETFLLVNELGHALPVYNNKPAKDLSNAEIKTFFAELKDNPGHYDKTQKRILALAIMREAMYRATGQFPFSTQMISIIDCMMHEGDVIANIDTGQGKSLIDIMKAAFLYLESDRVDITTSTLVDAARDIENYSPFLSLLHIPFAKKPIHANTPISEFCQNGINFSTFSQLGLRFSKAMAAGEVINPASERVSLVLNESDYALLDDRAIKRLAVSPEMNITQKHPWIYEAVNAFVKLESFRKNDTGANEDARRLRRYLISQAKLHGKPAAFIKDIEKETLITWIESAILVNYELRENFDYVILPVPGKVGQFFARILMSDARPSPDSVFGKGMQQLIHANLNQDKRFKTEGGENAFEITPENRTIISTDNRTLIDYYRSKKGFIWGSSGTVGSAREISEQAAKYGFAFSKVEPHQKKQTKEKSIVILPTKEAHYRHLEKELQEKRKDVNAVPLVIFCENIDKAKDIHAYMTARFGAENIQLNTGTHEPDAEKELIKNAAKPGMCTITTSAIGRNTDIPYHKKTGLDIWFTSIDSTRLDMQKKGRTGRQGSPGEIAYFLNQEDQNIKSDKEIAALRESLDAAGKKEREYHESLYKVIGFFLAELEKIPSAAFTNISKHDFIYRKWSGYSEQLELRYRELILKLEFDQAGFFNEAKLQFTALLQEAIPAYQPEDWVLDETVFQNTIYSCYTKPVRLNKCTPPVDIIYQLFHKQRNMHPAKALTKSQEEAFLQELHNLFSNKNYTANLHTQFFNTLFESEASCTALKNLYQTYLHTFLSDTQPCSFIMRWLGFNTPLNNIANDKHYIVLFRAFASVDPENPIVDADEIKRIATAMIEEYLQNSWWISHEKRDAAIQLQNDILSSANIGNIIKAICDTQVAVAEKDIASNKNRYGDSRLQNTLSNVLTMAASLGVQTNTHDLIPKLSLHLNTLTGNEPENVLNIETVKQMKKTTQGNAHVLAKSLAKALQLGEAKTHSIPGMEGRQGPKM